MDIVSSVIYIVLFTVLLVFVFSMGLLTPMIGKKDFLSVIAIGCIVGLIGGGFLIAPVYDELPNVVGPVRQVFAENEVVFIEFSTNLNASNIIKQIEEIDGVTSVENNGLFLETTSFSDGRKKIIEEKIPIVDENFKSWNVNSSGKININITEGYDSNHAIKVLSDWLMYTAEIETKYSVIKVKINVESNKIDNLLNYLEANEIVISSVEGPVQSTIEDTKNTMLDRSIIIFCMGILGIIVALFGIHYDETIEYLKKSKKELKIKIIDLREEIKDKLEELVEDFGDKKEVFIENIRDRKEVFIENIKDRKEGFIENIRDKKEVFVEDVGDEKEVFVEDVGDEKEVFVEDVGDEKEVFVEDVGDENEDFIENSRDNIEEVIEGIRNKRRKN
ncbi:MAG: hypothetical protein FWH29_10750 [Methanobrevibacter sp.]|nr:hypothetical protein [Methanobrevibacter sp.]